MSEKKGLLAVPDDGEIAEMTGFMPKTRTVLHEWPLSRVELASSEENGEGEKRIVKSQLAAASVEGRFYRYAGERKREGFPFLLSPLAAETVRDTEWLVLPYAEGEPEDWGSLSDGGVRERSRELNALFRELDGAPVFADWSRHELFAADIREILPSLARGKDNPRGLTEDGIGRLLRWTEEDARALWSDGIPVGLNHGDLKGDNLILSPGGRGSPYVIDWQRPLCAPLPLEPALSLLLVRPDTDAANQLSDPFFRLACALEMRWYAWAWQTCLPWPFVRAMAVKYAGMCIM